MVWVCKKTQGGASVWNWEVRDSRIGRWGRLLKIWKEGIKKDMIVE